MSILQRVWSVTCNTVPTIILICFLSSYVGNVIVETNDLNVVYWRKLHDVPAVCWNVNRKLMSLLMAESEQVDLAAAE